MIREEEQTRDKLKFLDDKKLVIHLNLNNGRFLNGTVTEYKDDSIVFNDDKLGDQLVFFSEIKTVERRLDKE